MAGNCVLFSISVRDLQRTYRSAKLTSVQWTGAARPIGGSVSAVVAPDLRLLTLLLKSVGDIQDTALDQYHRGVILFSVPDAAGMRAASNGRSSSPGTCAAGRNEPWKFSQTRVKDMLETMLSSVLVLSLVSIYLS